jgi:hypothetical protein
MGNTMNPEDDEQIQDIFIRDIYTQDFLDASPGGWNPMPRKGDEVTGRTRNVVSTGPAWYTLNEKGESVRLERITEKSNNQRFHSQMKTHFPDGSFLSTIHLSLDHQFFPGGPPILWESLWFNIPESDDEIMERYTSLEEAVSGHNRMVNERFEKDFNNGSFRRPDAYDVQDVLDQLSSETTHPRTVHAVHDEDAAGGDSGDHRDDHPPGAARRLHRRAR